MVKKLTIEMDERGAFSWINEGMTANDIFGVFRVIEAEIDIEIVQARIAAATEGAKKARKRKGKES